MISSILRAVKGNLQNGNLFLSNGNFSICYNHPMRRRLLIFLIFAICLAPSWAEPARLLRMSVQTGAGHPYSKAAEYFARLIGRRSDDIEVKLYPDGAIGNTESTLSQISFGGIALALVDAGAFPEMDGLLAADDRKGAMEKTAENWEEIKAIARKRSAVPIAAYSPEMICFYAVHPVLGMLEDLTIGELDGTDVSDYIPRTIELEKEDVFTALTGGTADAVSENFVDFCQSERYRFATEIMLSERGAKPVLLIVSEDVFALLPREDRELIAECAHLSALYADSLLRRAEENHLAAISKEKNIRGAG